MKTKRFAFHLSLFALAAVLTLAACSKDQPANEGTVPVTEEELLDQGITQATIRLSIGTEHIDDIIADLERGFAAVQG